MIRCGLYLGLYGLAVAATFPWDQPIDTRQIRWQDVTFGYEMFVVPLFVVDCALCASRIFHDEIRHQTLASLLMLPRSIPHLVYSKITGCLFGLIPGAIAVLCAFLLLPGGMDNLMSGIDEPAAWWFGLNLLLLIHLCLVVSLYLRWGAIAMSFALTSGSMMLSTMFMSTIQFSSGFRPDHILGVLVIPVSLAIASCHLLILLRLPALGEK